MRSPVGLRRIMPPTQTVLDFAADHIFLQTAELGISYRAFFHFARAAAAPLLDRDVPRGEKILVEVQQNWISVAYILGIMSAGYVVIPVDANSPDARKDALQERFAINIRVPATPEHMGLMTTDFPLLNDLSACLGVLTSGSSGTPKLVMHNWRTLLNHAASCNELVSLTADDRTLLSLPLYHIGGFMQVLRCLNAGSTLVINGVVEDAENLVVNGITHASLVSTQLQRLVEKQQPLPALKALLLGGGPCSEGVLRAARDLQYPVWRTYGLTETASQLITENPAGQQFVMADNEIRLAEDGEVLVRGRHLFMGYWHDHRLETGRDEQGWFHTCDLAEHQGNRVVISGRRDNLFISGGRNIQPEEIESYLLRLDAILEAVVVPVPHPEFGRTAFAFVRLRTGDPSPTFAEATIARLKMELPGYMVPRQFAALPELTSMKVQRRELAELALSIVTNR